MQEVQGSKSGGQPTFSIRSGKARIPDELWPAAVEVARQGGVNRTAAALRLNGGEMMKQLRTADAAAKKPGPKPHANHPTEYVVEIESGDGAEPAHPLQRRQRRRPGRPLPRSAISFGQACVTYPHRNRLLPAPLCRELSRLQTGREA